MAVELNPDIIISDIMMPVMDSEYYKRKEKVEKTYPEKLCSLLSKRRSYFNKCRYRPARPETLQN